MRSEYVSNVLVTWPVPVNGSPGTGVAPVTPTDVAANAEGITCSPAKTTSAARSIVMRLTDLDQIIDTKSPRISTSELPN